MSKLLVRNYYPATVQIDGADIKIRVHRLSATEFRAWAKAFDAVNDPPSERALTVRDPAREDEQAKQLVPRAWTEAETAAAEAIAQLEPFVIDMRIAAAMPALKALIPAEPGDEEFVMPDAEVRKRRLAEMTPEQRAAWDVLDAADEQRAADFIIDTISRYVTVEAGEIEQEGEDGTVTALTSGADVVRFFGGHASALRSLVGCVREENTLSTALKNALRSARDSRRSSDAADLDPVGAKPDAPVPPVESGDSAATADVTASIADAPSGSTETSI